METPDQPQPQRVNSQVETRLVEVWVNRVLHVIGTELKLKPIEALLVLREAGGFIEKTTGTKLDQVEIIPDVPPTKEN